MSAPLELPGYNLKAILNHPIKQHVILIDDARCFDGTNGYPYLDDLLRVIGEDGSYIAEVSTDIIRLIPRVFSNTKDGMRNVQKAERQIKHSSARSGAGKVLNSSTPASKIMLKNKIKKIPFIAPAKAIIKAQLQQRRAQRELAFYRAQAQRKGVKCPQGEALKEALRERLAGRRSELQPKPKDQLHIFLAYYMSNWEAILPKALAPFGRVTPFEWRSKGFDKTAPDWLARRDAMNALMLETFHAANRDHPVDVVIGYLSGYNTAPETLEEMARAGAAIFNFCWDDKLCFCGKKRGGRYTGPAAIAHAADLNLTNAPDSVVKYAVHGGLAMFWPEAAHPGIHRPYDLPFEFDVTFVGECYGWRPNFIKRLCKLGIKVGCFGNGWSNGRLSDHDMVKMYSRSRINLGFAGVGCSRELMCLKGRDFEVPMAGGLYLTQDNPELSLVYHVGREILTYKNAEDCAEKAKWIFANPGEADKIRKAGRKRALRDHTWQKRFEEIFHFAGILAD